MLKRNYFADTATVRVCAFLALIAIYFILQIIFSLLPPTARDELVYHLWIPKEILSRGGFYCHPDNIFSYYPPLGEILFTLAYGAGGEVAAKLVHVGFGALLSLALFKFARRYLNIEKSILAVLVFLSVPTVFVIMSWAYVDLIFSTFAFLATVYFFRGYTNEKMRDFFIAGIFLGGANLTKYAGISLMICFALTSLLLMLADREKRGALTRGALLFYGIGSVLFLPVLIRNYTCTGWPLFPFETFSRPLRANINWDQARALLCTQYLASFGAALGEKTIWHALVAPVLVFIQGQFNEPRYYEGIAGLLFLTTPYFLWKSNLAREMRALVLFLLIYILVWGFMSAQVRFLIPILPVFSFFIAAGCAQIKNKILASLIFILIAHNIFLGVKQASAGNPWPYLVGKENRTTYLSRHLPGYELMQRTNKLLTQSDRVLLVNMKNYVYYLEAPWTADFVFERARLETILERAQLPEDVRKALINLGITHILIDETFAFSKEWGLEGKSKELFQRFIETYGALLTQDGNYKLYKI